MKAPVALALDRVYDSPVSVEWKLMGAIRTDEPTTTNADLAKRIGVNVNTITRWLRDPHYQRYENWLLRVEYESLPLETKREIADVGEALTEHSSEMAERLLGIIRMTGDAKLEASLCQDWLDRAGFAPQRKVQQSGLRPIVITEEAAAIFFRRAQEAGLPPVDAEVIPSKESA